MSSLVDFSFAGSTRQAFIFAFSVVAVLLPVIAWVALSGWLLCLSFGVKRIDLVDVFSSSVVFGLIGSVVAFVELLARESLISGLLPGIVVVLGYLFQFLGRVNRNLDVPIESKPSLVGASNSVLCFLFAFIYFSYIFPERFSQDPAPKSLTAPTGQEPVVPASGGG